ncbi:MAG: hypothetical protein Q9170_007894 [Blastenia crenularia]
MAMKYLLVSGGVMSGIGKGTTASSLGVLLKSIGLKEVTTIKIDPHGECFVLDDGGEVDLDLGNYERYLNITLTRDHNITTGKLYLHAIERERQGGYLGKTVQIVPHVTDAFQDWIERVAQIPVDSTQERPDICIIELGGTVGDIDSRLFTEALRRLRLRAGSSSFFHCHVSRIFETSDEQKTKPVQTDIREVRSEGLSPDIIACRCSKPLRKSTIDKVAEYCQVKPEEVIGVHNVSTYHVPAFLERRGLIPLLKKVLDLDSLSISPSLVSSGAEAWETWKNLTKTQEGACEKVKICLIGKYTSLRDAYLSVEKSLEHASMRCGRELDIIFLNSCDLELQSQSEEPAAFDKAWHHIRTAAGILVPGGFGERGTGGMVAAAKWAREKKVPYLGICLGMQIAVIEYCRALCGLPLAQSEEFDESAKDKVIINMPEVSRTPTGAGMRLGLRNTTFQENSGFSKLRALYEAKVVRTKKVPTDSDPTTIATADGEVASRISPSQPPVISERHRHRYEVNPEYVLLMASHGLDFIGKDESGERMEIMELKDHPWFVGVQYHPEYLSRVLRPSMPYLGFVAAATGCLDKIMAESNGMVDGYANGI